MRSDGEKIRDDARWVWIICRASVYDRYDEFGACHWHRHRRSRKDARRTVLLRYLARSRGPFRLLDSLPLPWGKAYYCRRVPTDLREKYCAPDYWTDEGDLAAYYTEDGQNKNSLVLEPDAELK